MDICCECKIDKLLSMFEACLAFVTLSLPQKKTWHRRHRAAVISRSTRALSTSGPCLARSGAERSGVGLSEAA